MWRWQDDHIVLYSIDNRIPDRDREVFCVDDISGISSDSVLVRDLMAICVIGFALYLFGAIGAVVAIIVIIALCAGGRHQAAG